MLQFYYKYNKYNYQSLVLWEIDFLIIKKGYLSLLRNLLCTTENCCKFMLLLIILYCHFNSIYVTFTFPQIGLNPIDTAICCFVGNEMFRFLTRTESDWVQYGYCEASGIDFTCVCWLCSERSVHIRMHPRALTNNIFLKLQQSCINFIKLLIYVVMC